MNNQELIQAYLRQLEQEENLKNSNTYDKLRGYSVQANRYGNNLTTAGNILKENVNNEVARKLGTSMSNLGGNISNGATSVSNTLNKPANYFKGYANGAINAGLQKLGLANAGASIGSGIGAGTGAATAGTTAAGTAGATAGATTGAATGAATTAGTAAGAAGAGAGAAGAGTAAGTAAGSGAAAGGAAAGGSAASGAAAAGPIGALVALGVMAAMGTNRKRAKKSGQALMGMTNDIVKQGQESALQDTQASTAALQEAANQSLAQGIATGGAAPIENNAFPTTKDQFTQSLKNVGWDDLTINSALNGLNLGNKEMSDYINAYNQTAADGQAITIPQTDEEIAAARALANGQQQGQVQTTEEIKNGILDKFINGITDFSRGYNENRNTAFNPNNLAQKQFQETVTKPNQILADYQQSLLNKGYDNNIVNAVAQGKNSGNKEIADWISKNPDAFQPQTETKYYDKSKMGRFGEAFGTVGRAVQTPAVQALIAGGLSTALTGNPLYGLGMAQKFGNARAMSNIYQDVLAKQGIETNPGMFGQISHRDMDAIMTPELKKIYYQSLADWRTQKLINDKDYKDQKLEIDKQNADSRAVSAGAAATRADKYNGGAGRSNKPENHPDWNDDLAGFTTIYTDPRYASKANEAKIRFMAKHGVDPMKYIKL